MQRRQKKSRRKVPQCPESLWRRWPGACVADRDFPWGLSEVKREGQRSRPTAAARPSLPPVAPRGVWSSRTSALPAGWRRRAGTRSGSETYSRSCWGRLLTDHPSPLPWGLAARVLRALWGAQSGHLASVGRWGGKVGKDLAGRGIVLCRARWV